MNYDYNLSTIAVPLILAAGSVLDPAQTVYTGCGSVVPRHALR